ncbi:MAG: hypothetical protein CK426_04125 [Legionella sp.]|nr:MAG: hypothetical protein CK423_03125 [Legionella sp.]PJD99013.1 MAG: hypothetical protein CK426_04125 [Legionella sp.]
MKTRIEGAEQKNPIVIIGAGAAGFSAAIELAEAGHQVELIERHTLGSGASGRNPGRMGHGFHYTDINTAIAYLHASILVQKKHPGYLVGQALPFDNPLRHGRYFITKDSNPPKEVILQTYEVIKQEYKRLCEHDPSNMVFGPPDLFFRILEPSEYCDVVNMDVVDIGIETAEHLFNWQHFISDIKERILSHPNITLREHTEVISISRNDIGDFRFTIAAKKDSETLLFKTNYIVNSTWQDIKKINDSVGLRMIPGERTNRLKTLLVLELPESLKDTHSMFFCMGQHCMISNLGNRKAMATFARITNLETSSDLCMSDNAQRLLDGKASLEEKQNIATQMLKGISHYIPEIHKANIIDLQFGIVQTQGNLALSDLNNPSHSFHKRDDHCVRTEQIGLISNPCMKLFYFVDNGRLAADLIKEHMNATEIIHQCMLLIQDKTAAEKLPFDKKVQRAILENMERYEPSRLNASNIEDIATHIVNTMRSKIALHSIFSAKKTTEQEVTPEKSPKYI